MKRRCFTITDSLNHSESKNPFLFGFSRYFSYIISIASVAILLFVPGTLFSDNVRGNMVDVFEISSNNSGPFTTAVGLEELIGLELDLPMEMIGGIEFHVHIPESYRQFPGAMGFFVYKSIYPEPNTEEYAYTGERLAVQPLPGQSDYYFILPTNDAEDFQEDFQTAVFETPAAAHHFPLIVSVIPFMKALTDRLTAAEAEIEITPIFRDVGGIDIAIDPPEDEELRDYEILIDGESRSNTGPFYLPAGLHEVVFSSGYYQRIERTVGIEAGEITSITFSPETPETVIHLDFPEGFSAYLDGNQIIPNSTGGISVEPGEHTIEFSTGDHQISRTFQALPGREYELSLILDILIQED
ncbi:MAG: hypothetical protein ACLFR1_05365 [Spirochaetia bacterium]